MAPAGSAAPIATDAALAARLCANRTPCGLRARHSVPGAGVELVETAIARGAEADGCDGGEYWIVQVGAPFSARRIARDCDAQGGADNLAHARVTLDGAELVVSYEEGRSSDRCEGVDARFRLAPLHLIRETRWDGEIRARRCGHDGEITTDWDASDHLARFTQARCNTLRELPASPATGAAIPRFELEGAALPSSVGSCGVLVDASRAARWKGVGQTEMPEGVRLRALVAGDRLLIDLEGATTGSLSLVTAALATTDGPHGEVGCESTEERAVSTTTLYLEDGRIESRGTMPPVLQIAGRESSTVHVRTELIGSIGRAAIVYASKDGKVLATAAVPANPTAGDLPPIYGPFKASERCGRKSGRLDVRADNALVDPALPLR